MSDQIKSRLEEEIEKSSLSKDLQKRHMEFCHFLFDNEFFIESEEDGNGWKIMFMSECIGHMNFANVGIWIDTCDFGSSALANDALKETAWAHVRSCEHFSSVGSQCGCGRQPGFSGLIFGKEYENLCFARLEFMNPDTETLEDIKRMMLLFKRNKRDLKHAF